VKGDRPEEQHGGPAFVRASRGPPPRALLAGAASTATSLQAKAHLPSSACVERTAFLAASLAAALAAARAEHPAPGLFTH
jgi:hypothetical protein